MLRLLIIAQESKKLTGLGESLERNGFACSVVSGNNGVVEQVSRQSSDMVLVEIDGHSPDSRTWELIQGKKQQRHLPACKRWTG